MERSHPLNSHSTELYCQHQSIRYIDHASSAGKCTLWSPLLEVLCKRNLMRSCQQRTGKQINGTQPRLQGQATQTHTRARKQTNGRPDKPGSGSGEKALCKGRCQDLTFSRKTELKWVELTLVRIITWPLKNIILREICISTFLQRNDHHVWTLCAEIQLLSIERSVPGSSGSYKAMTTGDSNFT